MSSSNPAVKKLFLTVACVDLGWRAARRHQQNALAQERPAVMVALPALGLIMVVSSQILRSWRRTRLTVGPETAEHRIAETSGALPAHSG
jgi:hypothetical protein